jgi:hypothetical protein
MLLAVAPLIFKGPFVFVVPVPVIVPPVQLDAPESVNVPVPWRVPELKDKLEELLTAALSKLATAPAMLVVVTGP